MSARFQARFGLTLVAAAAALTAASAHARTMPLGEDGEIRYNFTANYALAQRLEAPHARLTDTAINPNVPNADDGNLNFKKNAIINNRISVLGEADIRYAANQGVFVRAQAFYDDAYHGKTDNKGFTDNHAPGQREFAKGTRRAAGGEAEFLDVYWYGDFQLSDESAINLNVGRHVVQWGEGLFFANIAGAQAPVDVNKINVPGSQVKDFLLPVGQVSANYSLNHKTSLMAYWQYEFRESKIPAAGSFWSVADFLGPGAENMFLGGSCPMGLCPRGDDIEPRKSGQWGIGARYITDAATEFGLYHLRYHSRGPSLQVNVDPTTFAPVGYQVRYQDNIKLTGASISARAGDVAVAGEVSYKQNTPVWVMLPGAAGPTNYIDGMGMGQARGNVVQAQVNSTYIMGPNPLAYGGITLLGEVAYQHAKSKKTNLAWANSRDAAAISVMAIPSYPNVFEGWDLAVPVSYMQAITGKRARTEGCEMSCHATFPNGDSLTLLGDKEKRLSLGANFTYLSNLQVGLNYTRFMGRPDYVRNPVGDRDNIAFNVKYNF